MLYKTYAVAQKNNKPYGKPFLVTSDRDKSIALKKTKDHLKYANEFQKKSGSSFKFKFVEYRQSGNKQPSKKTVQTKTPSRPRTDMFGFRTGGSSNAFGFRL